MCVRRCGLFWECFSCVDLLTIPTIGNSNELIELFFNIFNLNFTQQLAPRQADELHTRRMELQQEESILRDKVANHREKLEDQRHQQETQREETEQKYVVRVGFVLVFGCLLRWGLLLLVFVWCLHMFTIQLHHSFPPISQSHLNNWFMTHLLQSKLTRIKDKISTELRKINTLHSEWTNRLISEQKTSRDLQETLDDLRNAKLGV